MMIFFGDGCDGDDSDGGSNKDGQRSIAKMPRFQHGQPLPLKWTPSRFNLTTHQQ